MTFLITQLSIQNKDLSSASIDYHLSRGSPHLDGLTDCCRDHRVLLFLQVLIVLLWLSFLQFNANDLILLIGEISIERLHLLEGQQYRSLLRTLQLRPAL